MFIYACAVSLSKQKNTPYCLSSIRELNKFTLTFSDRAMNRVKYTWFRATKYRGKKYAFEHLTDNFTDYAQRLITNSSRVWYYGYFQGLQYFSGCEEHIRDRFECKKKYRKDYQQWVARSLSAKTVVAVHIRRGDYKEFDRPEIGGPDLRLPFSYYHDILGRYKDDNQCQIVFLSDDIGAVKAEFSGYRNAVFSDNSAMVDLQILKHADVLILANSSFSWWGAFLNTKQGKVVFVPKYFLGFKVKKEYPVNIILPAWKQIEVNE